ncbi:hypothetical protein FHL15_011042 [Xylaria flabelliformis]|uniref:Rhodopsin domain-containing protein n=1 Tax=Xylaria flabelliformis TaxID=2512241 RepID=A0A553HJB1_9PEZI|nr:hypothetical protein FHL15_011042 [Xylaria flabelliformis]
MTNVEEQNDALFRPVLSSAMAESHTDWSLLEQIPALPPPPGVQSNFDNPQTREGPARIVVGLTYGLMLIFLALRIYTRVRITNSLGIDDYLSIAAGASITAFTGLSLSLFGSPLGPHQWNVRLSHFNASFLERTLSSIVLFSLSSLFVKTALLVLYLRVFAPNRYARMMIWVGITTIVAFYIIAIILNIRFCVPISMTTPVPDRDAWVRKLKASNCSQPVYNLNAATGLFGVVSDLYVLIIPVSMVYKLKIPRNRKIGILGIFLTGLLYERCNQLAKWRLTLSRAVALSITSTAFRFHQLDSYDFTWDSIPSYTLRSVKRTPTPRMRTPSHAYIADLNRRDQSLDTGNEQLPRPPTPVAVFSLKSFIRQSRRSSPSRPERSTYNELGSMESG